MTLVVLPSKLNLIRDAKPLSEIRRMPQLKRLVVDELLIDLWHEACIAKQVEWNGEIEFRSDGNYVVIGLDISDYFVASFRGEMWPHLHACPECNRPTRCECAFGQERFRDSLALCPTCRLTANRQSA
jgi:hypothetical protein